jgi:hypothetical protein
MNIKTTRLAAAFLSATTLSMLIATTLPSLAKNNLPKVVENESSYLAKRILSDDDNGNPSGGGGSGPTGVSSPNPSASTTQIESILGPKPPIVGSQYLEQAGISQPESLYSTIPYSCKINVRAKWPARTARQVCLHTAPSGYILLKGDTNVVEEKRTCTTESDELSSDGATIKSRSEVENSFDAAIKLAADKKDIIDGLIKLENYSLRAYDFYSDKGTHKVVVVGKATLVSRAICSGSVNDTAVRVR